MRGVTPQYFYSILSQIDQLEKKVVWICSADFSRSLYLSKNYESVWGRSRKELYKDLGCWANYLVEDNRELLVKKIKLSIYDEDILQNQVYYQIIDGDGKVKFIRDTSSNLIDSDDKILAVGGIAEEITQEEWENGKRHESQDSKNPLIKDFLIILYDELKIKPSAPNKPELFSAKLVEKNEREYINNYKLTSREYECLTFLIKGQSAKEIARNMDISHRTVEIFLQNIKQKFACRTRMELLSKFAIQN